jgi:hypothetical protein
VPRRYYSDEETDRLFFVDGDEEPDGVFVEEIDAWQFYRRSSIKLVCGWPDNHWPEEKGICPCGCLFPDRANAIFHTPALSPDDEALL